MLTTIVRRILHPKPPFLRLFSTIAPTPPTPPPPSTPHDKQFEPWVHHLKPGFTPSDIIHALNSQPDPDLAYDIFRWASLSRGYKHDQSTYLKMLHICISGRRHRHALALLDEVLAGACAPVDLAMFNSIIKYCVSHRCLFTKAFDVYKKMISGNDCKPNLDTYKMLLHVLLRRFSKLNVSYVYMNAVRSLVKQMKVYGVIPDTYVLNMIIKAYAKCMLIDEAIRVFREMGLYGCEPNEYTYSYLVKGCCEKGRVGLGLRFYGEMRGKGLVAKSSVYMVLVCGLALERRFEDSVEILRDMLVNSMSPDLLTYRTLLEEMCCDGKGVDALELLEEFRKNDVSMKEQTYKTLLNKLYFVGRD